MLVESQQGEIVWSNGMARTVLGNLQESPWKSELHNRPDGDLFVADGHHYAVKSQSLVYEGEPAQLYWFFPMVSTIEQERDPLTNLPSFGSFFRNLERRWQEAQNNSFALGLLTIDIARFSVLNDVLGTSACDDLLCQVAKRFSKLLDDDCLFARVNGDQFVIATNGAVDVSDLHPASIYAKGEALIHRIVNDLEKPFTALGRPVNLKVSVGMSTSALSENPSDMIASSHRAMMGAKATSNEADWVVFNREMLKDQERQKVLSKELATALEAGHLKLLYQPFVDLKTGKLVGAEALIRWEHPIHGLLRPDQFLDAAEVSNMMFPIGRWVVEQVVQTAQAYPNLLFSFNLSSQQMLDPNFLGVLQTALENSKVKPEAIVIEILESSSSTILEGIKRVLEQLSEARIGLALDDADWDTRALQMLSSLTLRYVKVDRQVVGNLHRDDTRAFCKAILALAGSLERKSLGVGVESLEQSRFLKQFGCDWGQGHFFAQASPANEIEGWLAKPFLV
jgi:diguanylate cyclase (GGDEF)-like protein